MNPLKTVFNNTRKPEGIIGKMMAKGMNTGSHAKLAEWGFDHLNVSGAGNAIDLGCGGGANVARLLSRFPDGKVFGLDYSKVSVATAQKTNKQAILDGRCEIICGNVMRLPFDDNVFRAATAFETIYFWPDITDAFREVHRVLKPDGVLLIANESDGKHESSLRWAKIVDGMRVYTGDKIAAALTAAGFSDISVDEDVDHDRLCVTAIK